jgi:hypothetical protein
MKNKKYHKSQQLQKSNIKVLERQNRYIYHKYMVTHFHGLVQAFE